MTKWDKIVFHQNFRHKKVKHTNCKNQYVSYILIKYHAGFWGEVLCFPSCMKKKKKRS